MYPGTVTRVIMKFDLPIVQDRDHERGINVSCPSRTARPSPRTGGNEYVWHCHILEHEEHDMMQAAGGVL